jgi:hypothetical protein
MRAERRVKAGKTAPARVLWIETVSVKDDD